jgi:hypothetical protein
VAKKRTKDAQAAKGFLSFAALMQHRKDMKAEGRLDEWKEDPLAQALLAKINRQLKK